MTYEQFVEDFFKMWTPANPVKKTRKVVPVNIVNSDDTMLKNRNGKTQWNTPGFARSSVTCSIETRFFGTYSYDQMKEYLGQMYEEGLIKIVPIE